MIAVDTNILVYAHREDSPWHEIAMEKMTGLANSGMPWAIPWSCVHEFIAIVTHPKIYNPPTPIQTAMETLSSWQESESLRLIGEGPGYLDVLSENAIRGKVRGSRIHDARIASVCLHHGVKKLWTAYRDFSLFPKLRCENPLV